MRIAILSLLSALLAYPAIIIDTDAGSDDMMAIAYLLAHRDLKIEAIVVANGLAHVDAGAKNILRLCALAGREDIPVYVGPAKPLTGNREFPAAWRKQSDDLGAGLPQAHRSVEARSVFDFYRDRLARPSPGLQILALGPLTNFAQSAALLKNVDRLVIMGGAVKVPGNLSDGGTNLNNTAEWNIYIDAEAAAKVFRENVKIRLIPLDATNRVKIDTAYLNGFRKDAKTPLAKYVAGVLESDREHIEKGYYYAWDPLAAVALLHPDVATYQQGAITVHPDGRTEMKGSGPGQIALDASAQKFHTLFRNALMNLK